MGNRKYCIVVLDNTSDIEQDLELLIDKPLEIINSQNETVAIATFECDLSPKKLKKILNVGNRRTFFLFELDANTCATHIDDEGLHGFLFRELDMQADDIDELSSTDEYDEDALLKLDNVEREMLMDKLLNNVKTLNDKQKKALSFLANL